VLGHCDLTSTHVVEELGFDREVTETEYSLDQWKSIEHDTIPLDQGTVWPFGLFH